MKRTEILYLILLAGLAPAGDFLAVEQEAASRPQPARQIQPSGVGSPHVPLAAATPSDYLIGPGDLIEVSVFEEESLNRTVRVGPDGAITLPLLGSIPAGGRKKSELEDDLKRHLAEHFLFNPQVSVFVKEYRSKRVAVIGAVSTPGSYEMLGQRTLLEVISEAGGLAENAGRDLFVFTRGKDGSVSRTHVDLNRLMREGDPSLNIAVSEGDIINVPVEKPLVVYLYGAVGTPGMVEGRSTDRLTLLQAIARAGGPGQRAAVDRITIMRAAPDGSRARLRANLKRIIQGREEDLRLESDDIIVVPESFF